ncbi:MAG: beta-propeller domain-containing protein [Eubacteriales bacterium]|nr:beta-propeller domain-containing protein [Eubacteriales bacterium]
MRKKPFLYGVLIVIIILSGTILALAANQNESGKSEPTGDEVYLYTGSPLVLSKGEVKMLDPSNPDLGATVIESRTLLPLRAMSEYFGAEVTYDQEEKQAVIQYGGKQYYFPVGSKKYIIGDGQQKKEYSMDSQSLIIDGRTMVPLRVICENVLGKTVSYHDRVIAVADDALNLKSNTELTEEIKAKIGEAVKARTMKALEKVLTSAQRNMSYAKDSVTNFGTPESDGTANESAAPADMAQSGSGSDSYSTTNVQVAGIDEADIVKTDGKYIYIAGNNAVRIVGADNGKLSDDTAIRLSAGKNVNEIYVDNSRLILLGTRSEYSYREDKPIRPVSNSSGMESMPQYDYDSSKTYSYVDIYDISNPLKPVFLKGHEMEGYYQSSRKNGEIVYLVTNTYPADGIVLPLMKDTAVSDKTFPMELDDVMIMPRHPSSGYLVVSAINVDNEEKTEVEAITAYGATLYMNDAALYLAFNNNTADTSIIKFELAGMKIGYAGSGDVPGYLLNQFSMDEHEEHLRVATTDWEKRSNSLYILDQSLNVSGSVEDLAKGESIYSVRFMGDKGYVVTFRTMDPLFVFDLSDPRNPVLTGELKVPGFSSYLHPVGEDLLLGIGADTYELYRKDNSGKDVVVGTRQGGIKFSLFDVSDMGKPKEISKYVAGDEGSSSEALNNHKAIMLDSSKERVAIDAYLGSENPERGYRQSAVIMSYRGNKLSLKGILDSEPSGVYGSDIPYARRLLYIEDELYYVQDGRITSYDYESLKQIDTLVLQ